MDLETQDQVIQVCLAIYQRGVPLSLGKFGEFNNWSDDLRVKGEVHPFFAPLLGKPVRRYLTIIGKRETRKMIPVVSYFEVARKHYGCSNEEALAFICGANHGSPIPYYERSPWYFWHLAGIRVARKLREAGAFSSCETSEHMVEYAILAAAICYCIYLILSL